MNLALRQNTLSYLAPATISIQNQEESAECIVPDSSPDIERVLDTTGMLLLRGKECREGSCIVTGSIRAWVIYLAEGEQIPRRLELSIPFSTRVDHPALTAESQLQCFGCLKSLDTRIVHSRKINVRAGLCVNMQAWNSRDLTVSSGTEENADVYTKMETRRVVVPNAYAEKPFVISDELELPQGQPAVREILRWNVGLEITDSRLVGERAVFKGNANIELLYTAEQGSIERWQTQLPYSQYLEMAGVADEDQLQIIPSLTGAELEPDGAGTRLQMTLNAVAQCLAESHRELQILTDLYSVSAQTKPVLRSEPIESLLDRQLLRQECREQLQCPATQILAARVMLDSPIERQEQQLRTISVEAQLCVLYLDDEGLPQSVVRRVSVECSTELAERCVCRPMVQPPDTIGCVLTADGVELRFTLCFTLQCYASADLSSVESCELEEIPTQMRRPSVIVRMSQEGETLWSIAKACRSSVAAIRDVNGLDAQEPRPGSLLLIPKG